MSLAILLIAATLFYNDHMKTFIIPVAVLLLLLISTMSCAPYPLTGDWIVDMTFLASDNTSSSERFILRFEKSGKLYKNNKVYGAFEKRANNRIKFFSQDRKLVFYGQFINKNRIEGEGLHVPNDQKFAKWTALRRL